VPEDLVRLTITDVRTAVPAGNGVEAGLVILTEDRSPFRMLQIYIGQPEARAIQSGWRKSFPSRPSTWDVLVSAVTLLDGRLTRGVINAVERERNYFATIELERDGVIQALPCRPSDAIALVVRAYGAELFAAESVMMSASRLPDGSRPPVAGAVSQPEPAASDAPSGESSLAGGVLPTSGPLPPPEAPAAPEVPTTSPGPELGAG
jgi:bifunctional DNase/RNase